MPAISFTNVKTKIGLNTIYQILARFITAVTGLLVIRLLTSYLGQDGFGEYQIVLTYATIFWMLTDFGLNTVVVREMASNTVQEIQLLGSLFSLRALLSLVLILVSWVGLLLLPYSPEVKIACAFASLTILTQGIRGAAHGLFQVRLRYEFQALESLLGSLTYLAILFWMLNNNSSLLALASAFIIGQFVMMATSGVVVSRIAKLHFNFDWVLLKKIMIMTIPLGLSLLFNLGNFKLDAFLMSFLSLEHYTNTQAVAIYNVGYKYFEFALIVPTFLMNAVFPIMVQSYKESFSKFKSIFRSTAAFLLIISLIGVVLTLYLAPWAISLVADLNDYSQSADVLVILVIAAPIFFISSLLMWSVLTFNKQNLLVPVYATAFCTNLILNLVLIPKYAFIGAAITTGISELLILVLLSLIVIKHWREKQRQIE